MSKTIRLTVGQALVKFLNNQYIEFDGKETPMFEGVFGIFPWRLWALPSRTAARKCLPAPPP